MSELNSPEIEQQVIAILSETSLLDVGEARSMAERSGLSAEDFHNPAISKVFINAMAMLSKGMPVELLGMRARLEGDKEVALAGGWAWLTDLLMGQATVSSAFDGHVVRLKDLSLRRRVVKELRSGVDAISKQDAQAESALLNISSNLARISGGQSRTRTLSAVLGELVDEMSEVQEGRSLPIIPTGIELYDRHVGGLQPTLNVVGALPGVGKSAFVATVVGSMAAKGLKVGVFSLEDEATWLGWRLLSNASGVNQFVMRFRQHSHEQSVQIGDGYSKIVQYADNILLDDRHGLTSSDIVLGARDMVLNHKVQAIIIDHLGEVRTRRQASDAAGYSIEVAEGLSDLRSIAKKFKVPVLVCSHLSRRVADGESPTLNHFANSAAVERMARVAVALTREQDSDVLKVHVLKNTNGRSGFDFDLEFVGASAMIRATEGRIREPARSMPAMRQAGGVLEQET